jgi:hypothetical protein
MEDSAPESATGAQPHWLRRHLLLLIVVAALLLLYTLGGFLLLPHLARNAVIDYVKNDLGGRQASIGELDFNPFTFTVEVHQLALKEADQSAIASFDLLRVRASLLASLFNRAWTLSEVRLEQPRINALVARDGTLNLARLAPPEKPEQPPKPAPGSLPAVRIGALGVHGGSIHFEDRSRPDEPFSTTLSPIEFDLTDFRTAPNFANKYRFSAQSAADERLDWAGQFSLQPLGSTGEFTVTALKAATIADYLQDALPCLLTGGSLDLAGKYEFTASPTTAVSLTLPSIKVHSLGLAPRQGATGSPWIMLPELDVADTRVSLNERHVTIGQITLQRAAVQVWRNVDGSLNLQQLVAPKVALEPAAPTQDDGTPVPTVAAKPAPAAAPWLIALDRLELQDAKVDLEDRSVKPAFKTQLSAISLTAQNYASAGSAPLKWDLHLRIGDSGQLQTQGTVVLSSFDSALDLTLTDFDLPSLQPYLSLSTALTLYRGRLGVKGHIDYAGAPAAPKPKLQLAVAIDVNDLATRDDLMHEDLVSWRSLRLDGVRYQMAPDALSIQRIVASGAYGRVVVGPKGGLNVTDVLRPAGTPPPAKDAAPPESAAQRSQSNAKSGDKGRHKRPAAVAAAPPPKSATLPMKIARIDIDDSTTDFTDRSVQPTFSTAIYNLKGSVVGLSSDPASRATVDLAGSVDRYAPVSIKGQVNLLSATTFTDIGLSFSNIELPTFNPYSGKFAGYNIAQGKLSTDIHYHVENRKLDATHHIVIDQLEFGAATESKQAVPLPIKLAVSLLKDRNGVIDLNLPVGGSLDDPKFRIGPVIWKVFVNLMEKAVTAPFALLGSMFGGGGPQLSYVDFPAGSAALSSEQQQKLSQLAGALVERPQLKLDIPLHTQADDDDQALEHAVLDNALKAVTAVQSAKPAGKGPGVAAAGAADSARLRALASLYHTMFKDDPEYPPDIASGADNAAREQWIEEQLLPRYAPSAAQRDELGLARAQVVQSAVLANTELKPERVFLTNQVSGGGADGSVRMELKLE